MWVVGSRGAGCGLWGCGLWGRGLLHTYVTSSAPPPQPTPPRFTHSVTSSAPPPQPTPFRFTQYVTSLAPPPQPAPFRFTQYVTSSAPRQLSLTHNERCQLHTELHDTWRVASSTLITPDFTNFSMDCAMVCMPNCAPVCKALGSCAVLLSRIRFESPVWRKALRVRQRGADHPHANTRFA